MLPARRRRKSPHLTISNELEEYRAHLPDCLWPFKSSPLLGCSRGALGSHTHVRPPSGSWGSAGRLPRWPRCLQNGPAALSRRREKETGLRPCAEKDDFVIPLASCQTFHPSLPTGQAFLCSFVEVGCEGMYLAQFLSTFLIILPSTLVTMDFEVFLSKQAALHTLFLLLPKSQITRVLRIFL